ncbi:TonB-dependent receptor [Sphingomonas sp. BK235]|uniref:TonB-dependent receptor n=1 Tax=Sphingomonas sp. BK235 TaxID=2512131 RepID=UPI00105277D9|nr:TonB-dependent receptor [Sphingomonas sp. BK235]TCP31832.1 TonB-dependent receptor [Sphingomonas sp. BK235]
MTASTRPLVSGVALGVLAASLATSEAAAQQRATTTRTVAPTPRPAGPPAKPSGTPAAAGRRAAPAAAPRKAPARGKGTSKGTSSRTAPAARVPAGATVPAPVPAVPPAAARPATQAPAPARGGDTQPAVSDEDGRLSGDIVVVGLRENLKSARSAKRNAHQIVDVVLAQDIGKLPDKNVPEALARVPGVQIDRNRGEGGKVLIRGLDNVMTTVNGSTTFSAGDRTTYLQDIASDLVAGIEVYKTRTPDQIEGSQTGVINLTLRRPTDFKDGATYVLNTRGDYSDRTGRINPFLSALVTYSRDTDAGRLGFMVNGTYNHVGYNEGARFNELPQRLDDNRQTILPTTTSASLYAPFRIGFQGNDGWSRRAAFQASAQWKPDAHWTVTLEGGLSDQRMLWADSSIWVPIRYSESRVPPPTLSNITLDPDDRLISSLSLYGVDPIGPGRESWKHQTRNVNGRYQLQYQEDRFDFNGWLNYQRSNNFSNNVYHWTRFSQQPHVDVVFNDPKDPMGGPNITFGNIDLLDPANYIYVDGFTQNKIYTKSADTEVRADLKLNTFGDVIDYLKVGYRWNRRTYRSQQGRRSYGGLRMPISALPDYHLRAVGAHFDQSGRANWMIGDSDSIRRSFPAIRAAFVGLYPDLADPYPAYDPFRAFRGNDGALAGYGFFHYKVKLLFPIEGDLGARVVNSRTALAGIKRTATRVLVDGVKTRVVTDTDVTSRGNYLDVLPSLNAIVHITPRLQLRLARTHDVGRPGAEQMNPVLSIDLQDPSHETARGGNAKLRAVTTNKFDASLEWYFGTTGTASVAVWQWNQDGFIQDQWLPETLPDEPDEPILVRRPHNLGRGRHRGIEAQASSFFTFLPGILKSFGASANGTLNITRQAFPSTNGDGVVTYSYGPYLNVSKYVYNLVGFFERGGLNVRVAYNWQSRRQYQRSDWNPYLNKFRDPVERLDAAINYDVNKRLTIGLEGANLTRSGNRSYWGSYAVPNQVQYFSRTFALSVRTRW